MAELHILGSCSGTEPMPGRAHTSMVFCAGDRNYFFDAGECCSRTAYLKGIDMLKTRAIFISHTHYDHIGGLAGLIWCIRKLSVFYKKPVLDGKVSLFIPDLDMWDAVKKIMDPKCYEVPVAMPQTGLFYDDGVMRVSGYPSHHIPDAEDGHCRCYSYRIETAGKKIVFSGDIGSVNDLEVTVGDGCDLLLCETGHHKVKDVCDFAEAHNVRQLVFVHHGRDMLYAAPRAYEAIAACKVPVVVAEDGMTFPL